MGAKQKLYLRFGGIPEIGKSECHTLTSGTWDEGRWDEMTDERREEFEAAGYTEEDGQVFEPGVSVFELDPSSDESDEVLGFHIGTARNDDVAFVIDRPAFLVSGNRLEITGFCGEPLLVEPEIVEQVELISFKKGILSVRRMSM